MEAAELRMLRRTQGQAMALKLAMERKAASKVGHLPCLSLASRASLDALTGADGNIGFDDIFGQRENFENLTDSPFNVVGKYLDENRL